MNRIEFHQRTLVVADSTLLRLLELARKISQSHSPVLISGESGTGKELIARFIHEKGIRQSGPFISVNCAAIPEGLLEAELFGYERGAFTGALTRRIGKFEQANGGTLLLDEVSEMPLGLQAKLLRVLQEGEIDRLGGNRPIPITARVISTTNRDPLSLIREGTFRQDLYYRLNVLRVECAPLRGRKEAIVALAKDFILQVGRERGCREVELSDSALQLLTLYEWLGNVRELQNSIERAVLMGEGNKLLPQHFDFLQREGGPSNSSPQVEGNSLAHLEQRHIIEMLKRSGGNRTRAAEELGISIRTLRNKLKTY